MPVVIFALPVADFSTTTACLGTATTFNDLSITNALPITTPISSWDWDFGAGSAHSPAAEPTHTFA